MQEKLTRLSDYFRAAREQDTPLSLEEIRDQLSQQAAGFGAEKSSFTIKQVTGMTAILSVAIVAALWWSNEPRLVKPIEIQKSAAVSDKLRVLEEPLDLDHTSDFGEGIAGGVTKAPLAQPKIPEGRASQDIQQSESIAVAEEKLAAKGPIEQPTTTVPEEQAKVLDQITTLELPDAVLKKLGIVRRGADVFYENIVAVQRRDNKMGFLTLDLLGGVKGVHVSFIESPQAPIPFFPVYITSGDGKERVNFNFKTFNSPQIKSDSSKTYATDNADLLVPVLVKVNDRPVDDVLLWFEPTAEFLDLLPRKLAQEVKQEYELLTSSQKHPEQDMEFATGKAAEAASAAANTKSAVKATEYKYFESGNGNAAAVQYSTIYPNPTTDRVSISIGLKRAESLRISLADINGRLVKVFSDFKAYQAGSMTENFEISGIASGMYIVIIETQSGGRHSQRIMVQ